MFWFFFFLLLLLLFWGVWSVSVPRQRLIQWHCFHCVSILTKETILKDSGDYNWESMGLKSTLFVSVIFSPPLIPPPQRKAARIFFP